MSPLLISLLLATQQNPVQAQAQAQVPLTISHGKAQWGVIATAHGTVSQTVPSQIIVTLNDLSLQSNPRYPKGNGVKTLRICLAKPVPHSTWDEVKCSDRLTLNVSMNSGEIVTKQNLSFTVPVPFRSKISSYFLVLDMQSLEATRRRDVAYYAMSDGDPLQELQDAFESLQR